MGDKALAVNFHHRDGYTPAAIVEVLSRRKDRDGNLSYMCEMPDAHRALIPAHCFTAPYPYGEYIPTEGFDVARMPTDTSPLAVCYDSPSLHVPQWGTFWGDKFTRLMLPIAVEQIQAEFTHLYIVPPLTTK